MKILNYTTARKNLAKLMEDVCHTNELTLITKGSNCSTVLLSLKEYSSLVETAYLLKNPKNAAWLKASIASAKNGKVKNGSSLFPNIFKDSSVS